MQRDFPTLRMIRAAMREAAQSLQHLKMTRVEKNPELARLIEDLGTNLQEKSDTDKAA